MALSKKASCSEDLEFNKCGSDVLKRRCRGYPTVCLVALFVLFTLAQGCLGRVYKHCLGGRERADEPHPSEVLWGLLGSILW